MPRRLITILRLLTALVFALGLCGCDESTSPAPAPENTVRIVSSLPTRGYAAAQVWQIEQAIQLAIEERQGLTGRLLVEYLSLDNSDDETGEWSREKELANAQQAADDPSVVAYIGPYNSGAAMVSIPVTNRAGLLHVSPSATWPGLTQSGYNPGEPDIYYPTGSRNFIGMMPDDSLQAKVAAEWAGLLGVESVIVLTDGSTYSSGLANRFEQDASAIVKSKLAIDPLNLEGLHPQIEGSQAIFYAPSSVQNALALAHALRGLSVEVFSTDVALDPQFLDGAGADASRWHIVSNNVSDPTLFNSTTGFGAHFKRSFELEYGDTPGQFATSSYEITSRILNALATLEAKAIDRGTARHRFDILSMVWAENSQGPNGNVGFTAEGRPTNARLSGYIWRDDGFQAANVFSVSP